MGQTVSSQCSGDHLKVPWRSSSGFRKSPCRSQGYRLYVLCCWWVLFCFFSYWNILRTLLCFRWFPEGPQNIFLNNFWGMFRGCFLKVSASGSESCVFSTESKQWTVPSKGPWSVPEGFPVERLQTFPEGSLKISQTNSGECSSRS